MAKRLNISLSDKADELLQSLARDCGMSVSQCLSQIILRNHAQFRVLFALPISRPGWDNRASPPARGHPNRVSVEVSSRRHVTMSVPLMLEWKSQTSAYFPAVAGAVNMAVPPRPATLTSKPPVLDVTV